MKITGLDCQRSTIGLQQPFKTAVRQTSAIEVLNVTCTSENGRAGLGSATATWKITGDSLASIEAAVTVPIRDVVIGCEVEALESVLIDVQSCCVGNTSAKAAVDMALHDLYCKIYGLPLYQLLGGRTQPMETDITIGIDEPEIMEQEARDRIAQGYNVLKVKVGNDVEKDFKRLHQIRQAVGSNIGLRLDANQGWHAKHAVRFIQSMEDQDMGVELVEQPVPMQDFEGLRFVRDRVHTPIMADESVFSPHDAFRLLKEEAVDLLNIKLMKCGGLRQARQVADIAEAAGIECMIGSMMESSVSVTAAAHLAYAHNNITRYELDAPVWLKDEAFNGGVKFEGRKVTLPDTPGLGIEK